MKSVSELFSLKRIVEIPIEDGDSNIDQCVKLANIIEPYSCQNELKLFPKLKNLMMMM